MSKKLIAVAAAAALALTGLVVMPTAATATGPFTVTVTGAKTSTTDRNGSNSDKAYQVEVPSSDVLRLDTTPNHTLGTVIKLDIQTPGATDAITVTATGGVKVVTDSDDLEDLTTADGTQSLTDVAAGGDATIYAYNTSTTAATLVVSAAGSSQTIWLDGLTGAENAYSVAFTAPATVGMGTAFDVVGTVSDMFGNKIETDAVVTVTGTGGDVEATEQLTWDSVKKVYEEEITARTTAGQFALALSLGQTATKVSAFGTPATTAFFVVNATDLSTQVTALTAQVTALQAQLEASRPKATSVTKKKYNTLARKWNAANPGSRVALKK
jgi:hypothetical protein